MILPTTHQCDAPGCGQAHSSTNGWTALLKDREGILYVMPFAVAESKGLLPFSQVYCGAGHLHPAISAMLGEAVSS